MEAPLSRASNSRPKMTTVSRILRARCFALLLVLVACEQLAPENDNCLEDSACAQICIFACSLCPRTYSDDDEDDDDDDDDSWDLGLPLGVGGCENPEP